MEVDPVFEGVKHLNQLQNPERDKSGRLYLGSIDPITAANWARESGTRLGSKEWQAYCKKKLMSSEFLKFRADPERKVFSWR